jgi:hypothetical protein
MTRDSHDETTAKSRFALLTDWLSKLAQQDSVLLLICVTVPLAFIQAATSADPDLFHRLAAGELFFAEGKVPLSDPFAFSPTLTKWIDHEWLSGVVFYSLFSLGGDAALIVFRTTMFALTCLVTTRAAILFTASEQVERSGLLSWLLVTLLHSSFAWASVVRCQVFTYLFIPYLYLSWLELQIHGRKRLFYLLPLAFLIWCNAHGGFVLGLILFAILVAQTFLSGRNVSDVVLIFLLSIAITACNPYGFTTYWSYLIDALTMARPSISEWAPLTKDPRQLLLTSTILLPIGVGIVQRPKRFIVIAIICFTAYCGYSHVRLLACSMLTASVFGAPYAITGVMSTLRRLKGTGIRLQRLWAITLAFWATVSGSLLASSIPTRTEARLDLAGYPQAEATLIEQSGLSGKMLVDFNVGAFVLWRLYPRILVSMDSRYETVYPNSTGTLNSYAYQFGSAQSDEALKILEPDFILVAKGSLNSKEQAALESRGKLIVDGPLFVLYSIRHDR